MGGGDGLVRGLGIEAGSKLGSSKSSKKEDGEVSREKISFGE